MDFSFGRTPFNPLQQPAGLNTPTDCPLYVSGKEQIFSALHRLPTELVARALIRLPADTASAWLVPAGWQTATVLPLPGSGVSPCGHAQPWAGARPGQAGTAILFSAGQRAGCTSTGPRPLGRGRSCEQRRGASPRGARKECTSFLQGPAALSRTVTWSAQPLSRCWPGQHGRGGSLCAGARPMPLSMSLTL